MSLLINGHSVSFQYNFLVSISVVTLDLLYNWQHPYSVTISVPALPSHVLPSIFTSSIEVSLVQELDCDLVLVMNWTGLCCIALVDGVEFHPVSPEC